MRMSLTVWLIQMSCLTLAQGTDIFLTEFTNRKVFKSASLGISVDEVNGSKNLLSYRAHKRMIPASSLKVLTTFVARDVLGQEFNYETSLVYRGDLLKDGTLEGDLIIIGSGDPTLASKHHADGPDFTDLLHEVVLATKRAGIRCIAGKIIANHSAFSMPATVDSWQWQDIANYYGAGAWGLNVHDNLYHLYFQQQAKEGEMTTVRRYTPKIPGIYFINKVGTGKAGSGDQAYIFGGPESLAKTIRGTIPPGSSEFGIKGAIPNPPLFLAYHIYTALEEKGINSEGYEQRRYPLDESQQTQIIHTFQSPNIDVIARITNEKSDNIYAETLLKTMSSQELGGGTINAGLELINKILQDKGIDTESLRQVDGSGLSSANLISTQLLSEILKYYGRQWGLEKATSLLPMTGRDGTVRRFLQKKSCQGKVWAKSGSLDAVLSYCGYIKATSGKWLSFSVIVNHFDQNQSAIRKELEDLIEFVYLNY